VLFWATQVVESYTSYGRSQDKPWSRLHAVTRMAFNAGISCDQPRRATEVNLRVLVRSGLRLFGILQGKFAEHDFPQLGE
jgi:hypothetical protein